MFIYVNLSCICYIHYILFYYMLFFLFIFFFFSFFFFFSSRRRHTRSYGHWSSDVCSSDLVLNIYTYAPVFNAYFQSLGVTAENIVYSDYTSGELYRLGSTRGAIDPCFPAKIGIAHVHNLIAIKGARKQFNVIFFPMFDVLSSPLAKITGSNACPTVTATPETVKAAYTKETNVFADHGI